jgi:hypothetical protein
MIGNQPRRAGVRFSTLGFSVLRSLGLMLLVYGVAFGQDAPPAPDADAPVAAEGDSAPAPGVRRALLICGLAGDEEHRELFSQSLELLYGGLTEHHGFAAENVYVLWGDEPTDQDGPGVRASRGVATRETIAEAAENLRQSLAPDDALWVIVLGHAHFDGRYSWLNIAGSDVQHLEMGQLFEDLNSREQVFFITTASSGFFQRSLAAPGRIVITATEPDLEVNETLFPHKLAAALGDPPPSEEIDFNQDGRVTLLDVYLWTAREVAREYATGELLATEHSLLDDNGDGRGTEIQIDYLPEELGGRLRAGQDLPDRPAGDGLRAAELILSWPTPQPSQPIEE